MKKDYKLLDTLKLLDESTEQTETRNNDLDAETREFDGLVRKCKISNFLLGNANTGAELELRQATDCNERSMPLQLLDPALETRADAVSTVPTAATITNQYPALSRIFEKSVSNWLGCSMAAVGAGVAVYPFVDAGTSGDVKAPGVAIESEALTLSSVQASPKRLTARYKWRVEDTAKLGEFEQVLRRDLTDVLSYEMDKKIVLGVRGLDSFIQTLSSGSAPSAVAKFADFVALFSDRVDGITAGNLKDVKALIGKNVYKRIESEFMLSGVNPISQSVAYYLMERSGGWRVSNLLTSTFDSTSKLESVLTINTAYPQVSSVIPIWNNVELIRDKITLAATGEILTTAIGLFDHKFLRTSNAYQHRKIKVS